MLTKTRLEQKVWTNLKFSIPMKIPSLSSMYNLNHIIKLYKLTSN